jgi:hypothetical protein
VGASCRTELSAAGHSISTREFDHLADVFLIFHGGVDDDLEPGDIIVEVDRGWVLQFPSDLGVPVFFDQAVVEHLVQLGEDVAVSVVGGLGD